MNLLEQVTTRLGIKLISSRQPVKCGTVAVRRLFVQRILAQRLTPGMGSGPCTVG